MEIFRLVNTSGANIIVDNDIHYNIVPTYLDPPEIVQEYQFYGGKSQEFYVGSELTEITIEGTYFPQELGFGGSSPFIADDDGFDLYEAKKNFERLTFAWNGAFAPFPNARPFTPYILRCRVVEITETPTVLVGPTAHRIDWEIVLREME